MEFAETAVVFKLVALCGRQLAREPVLTELLQTLKVIDMAMFGRLSQEGFLASNRQAICHVTLAEDVRVALR